MQAAGRPGHAPVGPCRVRSPSGPAPGRPGGRPPGRVPASRPAGRPGRAAASHQAWPGSSSRLVPGHVVQVGVGPEDPAVRIDHQDDGVGPVHHALEELPLPDAAPARPAGSRSRPGGPSGRPPGGRPPPRPPAATMATTSRGSAAGPPTAHVQQRRGLGRQAESGGRRTPPGRPPRRAAPSGLPTRNSSGHRSRAAAAWLASRMTPWASVTSWPSKANSNSSW